MSTALARQWKIANHEMWKTLESWPDNEKTFHSHSELTKIYFYCNPVKNQKISALRKLSKSWKTHYNNIKDPSWPECRSFTKIDQLPAAVKEELMSAPHTQAFLDFKYENFGEYCDYNVGLYTDYSSQVKLAKYKRALYFGGTDTVKNQKISAFRKILKSWKTHYNNIKDPSWPECRSFTKIDQLPTAIKQQLMSAPHTQAFLDFKYDSDYQGQEVYLGVLPFLKSADVTVKLQDLINHTQHVLNQVFGIDQINDQQKDLIEHWKTLHPREMLIALGITTIDR